MFMKSEIGDLGRKIRSIYEHGATEGFSLFMGSFQFPKNSCEGASRVFAHIVSNRYPSCKVNLVEGYDHQNDDRHYWVLVDDLVYDLTCDQFNGYTNTIIGDTSNPLIKKYSELELFKGADIFKNWNPSGRYDKLATLGYVEQHLAST
jgi:hypothetical protein